MKQFVQNLKVLRTMSRRFFAVGILATATFVFTPRAHADPGHGAVVTHIDRDLTGGSYQAISPDGQLKLDVVTTGQGEVVRLNPDGTLTLQSVEAQAPVTLSVRGSDGEWVLMWAGIGSFHITGLVEATEEFFSFTGEAYSLHVEGKLINVLDGSEWSFLVVAVAQNYEVKKLKIDLQPR
ncbi:MAG TPA: hypothetical protein VM680_13350 [Verrucomicrobiae bacterium]|nr:hypothetical protein [Verrucomicrobiae bacterium]